MSTPAPRVYNEIYCPEDQREVVEEIILDLMQSRPELGLDMSFGPLSWTLCEDEDEPQAVTERFADELPERDYYEGDSPDY